MRNGPTIDPLKKDYAEARNNNARVKELQGKIAI
jgi:hypothetical protein